MLSIQLNGAANCDEHGVPDEYRFDESDGRSVWLHKPSDSWVLVEENPDGSVVRRDVGEDFERAFCRFIESTQDEAQPKQPVFARGPGGR